MEINQAHFRKELLSTLKHISDAAFVSFDLEMSGIATRSKFSSGDRSHDVGRPSLQQQYEEMKSAAETFQVLQVGITCVKEDREREYYLARPFNFNLSPLTAAGCDLRLERNFSFSSSACDFLSKNQFDFGKVFKEGVVYLSRQEEDALREEYAARMDKQAKIPDMVIPANEPAALDFYRGARQTISAWIKDPKQEMSFCNISSKSGPLNGYQRRLIYQLVRNEFPKYIVFARMDGSFMQVQKLDEKREATIQASKLRKFNDSIAYQKGLRWIFEALSGGDLSDIDPEWFWNAKTNTQEELAAVKLELAAIVSNLQSKARIIVGHNLFTDLGFLYKTFIGTLPTKVEYFQEDIHELFPTVIDTKYLATQGADSMNPRANLKDLLAPFKKMHFPLILLHEDHTSYSSSFSKEHEAGYDSWVTAELFVKLTAQLYTALRKQLGEVDSDIENFEEEEADIMAFSDNETDSSVETGGAPLFTTPNPFAALQYQGEDTPRAYTVRKITKPGDVVAKENEDEPDVIEPGQFIPPMSNSFWDLYTNKLRVQGTEGGVCDLAEKAMDESEESIDDYE